MNRFVVLWAVGLSLLFVVSGYFGLRVVRRDAAATAKTQTAPTHKPEAPVADLPSQSGVKPVDVLVGVSINRAGEFDLKQSTWTTDFNLWFLWSHDAVTPGESFSLVNGEVVQQSIVESYQVGAERYVEYQIVASMKMDFNSTRFPFADVGLEIQLEDVTHGTLAVRYVADTQHSGISPDAAPHAATIKGFKVSSGSSDRPRPSKNRPSDGKAAGRSQFTAQVQVAPDGWGIYRRMFQALFASVAVGLIALYIKPTHVDCRFGLPIGAFFASVSNNIFVGSLLPYASAPTLTDVINAVSLLTIFLFLVQSVISLYVFDTLGREQLSRSFDRVSFVIFLLGYGVINVALPLTAKS